MKVNKVNSVTKIIRPTKKAAKKSVAQTPAVKKLKPKELPNWLGAPDENYGNNVLHRIAFYPEDVEKMKAMTDAEADAYKDRLFAEHRYYRDNRPIVLSDKLAAILGDLSQYEVK